MMEVFGIETFRSSAIVIELNIVQSCARFHGFMGSSR